MKTPSIDLKLVGYVAAAALTAGGIGVLVGRGSAPDAASPAVTAAATPAPADKAKDRVLLSEAQLRAAGITLETAQSGLTSAEMRLQGTVTSSPQGLAVLSAGADGRIVKIDKSLGDAVDRGGRVAMIESREAASISADEQSAAAKLRLAEASYSRERKLYLAKVTARADYETAIAEYGSARAEAARATSARIAAGASGRFIAVRSPIGGRVSAAPAVLGTYVTAQSELFRIATSSGLRVEAALPIGDSNRVVPGNPVRLLLPGHELAGRVRAITPSASLDSRAATIVIDPVGGAGWLRAGQFVEVLLQGAADGGSALLVADEAVQSVGGRDVVFVRSGSAFIVRPVTIGVRSGGRVAILSGLQSGEKIASKNAFLVKAELEKSAGEEGE